MIIYNRQKMRVRQKLSEISLYDLEGDFDKTIVKLQSLQQYYINNYVNKDEAIDEFTFRPSYADGERKKNVKFDRIYVEVRSDKYDGEKVLEVWGERDCLSEEKAALVRENQSIQLADVEQKRQLYEKLKRQFEGK